MWKIHLEFEIMILMRKIFWRGKFNLKVFPRIQMKKSQATKFSLFSQLIFFFYKNFELFIDFFLKQNKKKFLNLMFFGMSFQSFSSCQIWLECFGGFIGQLRWETFWRKFLMKNSLFLMADGWLVWLLIKNFVI